MRPSPELRPTLGDLLAALCVAALAAACAAAFWFHGSAPGGALEAVVSLDGREAERFALTDSPLERTYESRGYTLHVQVSGGEVRVAEADCPTQDCVHTGAIGRAGQSIVCLPARVVIQLERADGGTDEGGVDAVVG